MTPGQELDSIRRAVEAVHRDLARARWETQYARTEPASVRWGQEAGRLQRKLRALRERERELTETIGQGAINAG